MSEFLFADEPDDKQAKQTELSATKSNNAWRILIVDDDESVHSITKTVLKSKIIDGKGLMFSSVFSGKDAIELLKEDSDFAVILLDVVMESDQAGLDACRHIREQLKLETVRIILRTGQPGSTPEEDVILKYRINDYKEKSDLTANKLFSCIVTAVRSYADITQLEASKAEIEMKAQQLELSNRYKSEFLANMSHELRTPLNSILILSELLAADDDENLIPDQIDSLSVINRSGKALLSLVEDILDLSQIEAGKMKVNLHKHHLDELTQNIGRNFNEISAEVGVAFEMSVGTSVPAFLCIDLPKVNQIINHLLTNAFKFTEQGLVKFSVAYIAEPDSQLTFEVSDSGIGIDAALLGDIFDTFRQGDGSTGRQYGGTGVGLSIAKELTTLISGELSVESTLGLGSKFTLTMPIEALTTEEPKETQSPQTVQNESVDDVIAKKQVLIVDDDARNIFSLIQGLKRHNMQLIVAENGQAALDKLEQHPSIDIVLMDIMMPVMDGNVAMKKIREQAEFINLPIIAITGKTLEADLNTALSSGATKCMSKPVDINDLTQAIGACLEP